jgi:calcineurin-like phosphoesterase family protein
MNIYFSSDLHFGHNNIIKYCNRPYSSVEEMDEALISNWNAKVQRDDVVYILGDVFFCQLARAEAIMHCLNGKKRLILGNHDKLIRREPELQKFFDAIYPDLHHETINGQYIAMCHYPLLTWHKAARGAWNLHGHSHGTIPFDPKYRRLDVGIDPQNYSPISFNDVKRIMDKVDPKAARDY